MNQSKNAKIHRDYKNKTKVLISKMIEKYRIYLFFSSFFIFFLISWFLNKKGEISKSILGKSSISLCLSFILTLCYNEPLDILKNNNQYSEIQYLIFNIVLTLNFSIVKSLFSSYFYYFGDPIRFLVCIETILRYLMLIVYNHSFKLNFITSFINVNLIFTNHLFFKYELNTLCDTIASVTTNLGIIIVSYHYEKIDFQNFELLNSEINYFCDIFEKINNGIFAFSDGILIQNCNFHLKYNFTKNTPNFKKKPCSYEFVVNSLAKLENFQKILSSKDINSIFNLLKPFEGLNQDLKPREWEDLINQIHCLFKSFKLFSELKFLGNLSLFNENQDKLIFQIFLCAGDRLEIVFINITDAVLLEKKENETKFNHLYLSKITHEFKNPILNISSLCSQNENIVDDSKDLFIDSKRKIVNLCQYMLNLVEDLKCFSNLNEENEINEEKEYFDLIDNINSSIEIVRLKKESDFQHKKIEFKTDFEFDSLMINSYPGKIKQILINILMNSLKFTLFGSIKIIVKEILKENENYIQIKINDSGIGIEKELLSKDWSLEDNLNRKYNKNGSGMGLFIVRHILLKYFNCELNIFSEINKGTSLHFEIQNKFDEFKRNSDSFDYNRETRILSNSLINLNLQDAALEMKKMMNYQDDKFFSINNSTDDSDQPDKSDLVNNSILAKNKGFKILICDDDEFILKSVSNIIKTSGSNCEFQLAHNGLEALNMIAKESNKGDPFDLLITDETMPIMRGSLCIFNVKSMIQEKFLNKIRICSLTAYSDNETIEWILKQGADLVLCKPFSKQKFKKCLDLLLS